MWKFRALLKACRDQKVPGTSSVMVPTLSLEGMNTMEVLSPTRCEGAGLCHHVQRGEYCGSRRRGDEWKKP